MGKLVMGQKKIVESKLVDVEGELEAFFAEGYGTMFFTMMVLVAANANSDHKDCNEKTAHSTDGVLNGFVIFVGLYVAINITAGVTGACLNPSVAFNLQFWGRQFDNYHDGFGSLWIYWAG